MEAVSVPTLLGLNLLAAVVYMAGVWLLSLPSRNASPAGIFGVIAGARSGRYLIIVSESGVDGGEEMSAKIILIWCSLILVLSVVA
ncbi:MAG: hypothetical protein WHT07_12695 [Desulfobaccales bacterium]